MRILEVVHGLPPTAQGGSEIYALAHARALQRSYGDEITVLTREQNPMCSEYAVRTEERDGLHIVWVNNTFCKMNSFEESYQNEAIGAIASRLVDDFKPDVAHIHHLTCLSTTIVDSLAERRIPSFYTLHDYWLMCHRGQLLSVDNVRCDGPGPFGCHSCLGTAGGTTSTAFAAAAVARELEQRLPAGAAHQLRRLSHSVASVVSTKSESARHATARLNHMRDICAQITHFLAPSDHMRNRFIRFGVPPGRISVNGYGFDHSPFRDVRHTSATRVRFGFLGSLMVSKAPHLLLEAFHRLPRNAARVTLYGAHVAYHGDDSYRAVLSPLLARDGVDLRGPIPHDQVAEALSAIDVLVVPSIWEENSPLVIREAFLAGVPVVASHIGGIPELVEHGVNGLLFRAGDIEDLHRVLARLVDDPALIATFRAALPPVRTIEDDVRFTRDLYLNSPIASRAATTSTRLATVVLNYQTPSDTMLAVRSLLASRRELDDIIVVDNDSGRACWEALKDVAHAVTYIQTGRNLGFSGGMNVGIRAALARGAGSVLLVNSDAIVPPDCVGELEKCLHQNRVGIVGPALRSRSVPTVLASLGMTYTPWSGRMRHLGAGERRVSLDLPARNDVVAISGCVMLVARAVFESIGFFDEDYFFYFEDLDFCWKARRAGFGVVLAGGATAYHEGGQSIGMDSPRRLYFAARNHLLMATRASTRRSRIALAPVLLSILALNIAHAVRVRGGSVGQRLRAVWRGARDYLAGRFGDSQ